MENEIWSVESIASGNEDDLFEAIITAEYGTKLIAQVPLASTADYIARLHNDLVYAKMKNPNTESGSREPLART